jgi:hypothetical protein
MNYFILLIIFLNNYYNIINCNDSKLLNLLKYKTTVNLTKKLPDAIIIGSKKSGMW